MELTKDEISFIAECVQNKMVRDSWSAKELAKVAEFCGCKLVIMTPDGGDSYLWTRTKKGGGENVCFSTAV